ncbi:GntR family transcriptional regulator [Lutibaculum baratangense]|uniref:Transcriptional regulator, GntR family n=1 Tax=Lutibaculum baratangense AMV1 TaxID=631454 RepID=V4TLC8_9HYPH|nr:GntR family transcriptional regulator [Lutibaculum baratangense]ESR26618.1 Transcriptional regulator, GntR family [Lutibaculum baratangense AMV1]
MDNSGIPRADLVYNWIKTRIREGSLRPGTRLREAELAEVVGVSRTPVREAINRLISEGQLVMGPGRGFTVAKLDRQQVIELYALREFLEAASARFAAQHASEPEIESLRELLDGSRVLFDDPPQLAILNKRFHLAISSAGHNRYSEQALTRLADFLGLVPGTTFQMEGRPAAVYEEHKAILDAIADRDADRAEAAARYHIHHAGKARLKLLFDQI